MLYHEQSEDYRPLFWISGRPIYAYGLLIILHILAFIAVGSIPIALMLYLWGVVAISRTWLRRSQTRYRFGSSR